MLALLGALLACTPSACGAHNDLERDVAKTEAWTGRSRKGGGGVYSPLTAWRRKRTWSRPPKLQPDTRGADHTLTSQRGEEVSRFDASRAGRLGQLTFGASVRTVIVIVSNSGQSHLLDNWVCAAEARGIAWKERTVVYALDDALHARLERDGVRTIMPTPGSANRLRTAAAAFGDSQFKKVCVTVCVATRADT